MKIYQGGILQPIPGQAIYITCNLRRAIELERAIEVLQNFDTDNIVIGIGQSFLDRFDRSIPGLKTMPEFASSHIKLTSTPSDLWIWLRSDDRGDLYHHSRRVINRLSPAFEITGSVEAFRYAEGRDLTGYEDGTENPDGEAAVKAAICSSEDLAVNGSSFVAVQQWQHDLDTFDTFPAEKQDYMIGRRRSDNEELDDAPASAHVKRTAQESFDPQAFLLRRSMPWSQELRAGLMFVAFGKSFNAFEAQINRMLGNEDDVIDALFQFSRVLSGAYYWCPPVSQGQLNLSAIGHKPEL
jgi:putative iron-dependent peroxidase